MSSTRPRREELQAAARSVSAAGRSPCLAEERLLAFHAGSLPESEKDEIRDHLATCASCVETGRDARCFLEAMGQRAAQPVRHTFWRRLAPLAAGVTLVLGGTWLAAMWRPAKEPQRVAAAVPTAGTWADIAVPGAAYVPAVTADDDLVWRDDGKEESTPDEFARAMEPYRHDDFAAAERALASYLARHPGQARAHFYRGVSLLLLGRARESLAPLQRVADGDGRLALEARWYLALACLKEGETDAAVRHLEAVERSSPERRAEAQAILLRVRAAQGR